MTTKLKIIPRPEEAALPARYEAAKVAIKECAHVDECKDWADKAAALASLLVQQGAGQRQPLFDRATACQYQGGVAEALQSRLH
jgi:hypothetical protein